MWEEEEEGRRRRWSWLRLTLSMTGSDSVWPMIQERSQLDPRGQRLMYKPRDGEWRRNGEKVAAGTKRSGPEGGEGR